MNIIIEPDYDLFVQILFALWILKGILNIGIGMTQSKIPIRIKAGGPELVTGLIILCLAAWIIF